MLRRLSFLPLLLLIAVPALAQRGEVVYDQSFDFRPGDVLDVATSSPSVVVRTAGRSGARVRVIGQGPNVRSAFEHFRFTARRQQNTLRVRTDPQGQFRLGRMPSFTIEVTIPDRADLQIATSSGSIRIEDVRGDVDVSASSGSVALSRVDGRRVAVRTSSGSIRADQLTGRDQVEVSASSGSIAADQVAGRALSFNASSGSVRLGTVDGRELDVRTSSGSISVGSMTGSASFRASSGSVSAERLSGAVEAQTSSGSIRLGLARSVPVRASASSGSVTLQVPSSLRASVDLGGRNIQIDDALRFQGDRGRRSVRGTLNGGGERITVNTSSGRIHLSTR